MAARPNVPAALAVGLAVVALAACPAARGPAGTTAAVQRGNDDAALIVSLRLPAGVKVPASGLLIGGEVYRADPDGHVAAPKALLQVAAREGGVWLVGPGLVPARLSPDQLLQPIPLAQATAAGTAVVVSAKEPFRQGGVQVSFPGGVLAGSANVAVSTYGVVPEAAQAVAERENDRVVGYVACPPSAGPACRNVVAAGLGVAITVGRRLGPGSLPVTLDLDAWRTGKDAARQAFAKQVLTAAATLGPDQKRRLGDRFGLAIADGKFTAIVPLGASATNQGVVRVATQGLAVLGVQLVVTIISPTGQDVPAAFGLPTAAAQPAATAAATATDAATPAASAKKP